MTVSRFDPKTMICREDDAACADLRRTRDEFYAQTSEYTSFHKVTHKPEIWGSIVRRIEQMLADGRETCRVMEFGAGTTGFPAFVDASVRERVHFTAQDVTPQNEEYLRGVSDDVVVGDVRDTSGPFDVIFSTFVWEHVTDPRATLGALLERLAPGGSIFLACPRYDTFGYTPATAKHYSLADRMRLAFWLRSARAGARRRGEASFLIHNDPAMLHTKWFRDADAVHWVAREDLRLALPEGYTLEDVEYGAKGGGVRGWIFRTFLLLFVEVRAPGGEGSASA